MIHNKIKEAPDYTNAALAMGLVNLLWIFVALWVIFGLHVVIAIAWGLNWLMTRYLMRQEV
ncbi:MAG: hypothetical protein AAGK67_14275 [Pseudomonadota bacterium]